MSQKKEVMTEQDSTDNSIYELLRRVQVHTSNWDIVGAVDGSGSSRLLPIGYGSFLYNKQQNKHTVLSGYASVGGVQEAETRAVFDLASYMMITYPKNWDTGYIAHIFTDSSYVASMLSNMDPDRVCEVKAHPHLWYGVLQAFRQGIKIIPHLLPRNSNKFMTAADTISKISRKSHVKTSDKVTELILDKYSLPLLPAIESHKNDNT
jgi:hypothetical protein